MCRHMYDWNIVNCDVKQPIHLTSPHFRHLLRHAWEYDGHILDLALRVPEGVLQIEDNDDGFMFMQLMQLLVYLFLTSHFSYICDGT